MKNPTTEVVIDGTAYNLNIKKAISTGCLSKKFVPPTIGQRFAFLEGDSREDHILAQVDAINNAKDPGFERGG